MHWKVGRAQAPSQGLHGVGFQSAPFNSLPNWSEACFQRIESKKGRPALGDRKKIKVRKMSQGDELEFLPGNLCKGEIQGA